MCGNGSAVAVETPAVETLGASITAKKIAPLWNFHLDENGGWQSHSEVVSLAKLDSSICKARALPDGVEYEGTLPAWYKANQAAYEKSLISLTKRVNAALEVANAKVALAEIAYNKAIKAAGKLKTTKGQEAATEKAQTVFDAARKTAFKSIRAMKGNVLAK